MAALEQGGARARFVGGCVRDAMAGRPVTDIDIATTAQPEEGMRLLQAAGIHVVPTGMKHGTITAIVDGKDFEITTLRHDVETYGRHARVAFTDDWKADAARRDFTINAMFCDADGTLYDPFGGLADLAAGRVRFVGSARQRIHEDVLRLLRYFRFTAHYGHLPADDEALAACREMAHHLPKLSGERVRKEILRLLEAPDPLPVCRLMLGEGILLPLLPEALDVARLEKLVLLEKALGRCDSLLRLAALLPGDAEKAVAVSQRLRLSSEEAARLGMLARERGRRMPSRWRQDFYAFGPAAAADMFLLAAAGRVRPRAALPTLRRIIRQAGSWKRPVFPLKGKDVLALGVSAGPRIGRVLGRVETWWRNRGFRPGAAACMARLRRELPKGKHKKEGNKA